MKRGVVVECNDDFVTLLTPDGQFLKTNNKAGNYELGEEICFFPAMDEREEAATRITKTKKRSFSDYFNFRSVRIGALSVLAIMFFVISFLPLFNNDKVYAYMSIDINPSFEAGINDQLKVISLEPLNEEAEMMIKKLPEWENKQFEDIVNVIVNESKLEGYVYPGKEIVLTTVINEADKESQIKLEKDLDEIRASYIKEEMVIKTIESDSETREKAQKQGVSTGKYVELQEKAGEELREDIQEPFKEDQDFQKQEESNETSTTEKIEKSSLPETTIANSQSAKDKLTSDTKDKLKEAKSKIKENSKKNKAHENRQKSNSQDNVSKQSNEAKKKNNENKDLEKHKNNSHNGNSKWLDKNDKREGKKDKREEKQNK